jgi:hypothetical protein
MRIPSKDCLSHSNGADIVTPYATDRSQVLQLRFQFESRGDLLRLPLTFSRLIAQIF